MAVTATGRVKTRVAALGLLPTTVVLLAAAVLMSACGRGEAPAKAAVPPPAVPVLASAVVEKDVPVQVRAIGNVQAYSSVSIYALVAGQIFKVHFTEGQEVHEGDLLFTLDPRPFQAALDQAQAQLAQHQAQVKQAEANLAKDTAQLEYAQVEERRYKTLVEGGYVAKEQYDQILTNEQALTATINADRAAIVNAQAMVKADEANIENAKVQLSYTTIRSPIDGRTGNLLIHEGSVVKANDSGNPLVVINKIHPIYVSFAVPEQFLDSIKKYRATGELKVDATTMGRDTPVQGDLTFVNNTVDVATGTIQLKATFVNRENLLWPGQYVNVALTLTTERHALLVPSQAIQEGQTGSYVFVVKSDSTVELRTVVLGRVDGTQTVITKGLAAGERVVTDGQLRLVPGVRVDVKATAEPVAPKPSSG